MAGHDELHRVAVYFDEDEELELLRAEMEEIDAEYDGVVCGRARRSALERLARSGLTFEPEEPPPPPRLSPPEEEILGPLLAGPEAQAPPLGSLEPPAPQPRETGPSAAREEEDLYHLRLAGPLSEEMHGSLARLGVDLEGREGPATYHVFSTPEQAEQVRRLPGVLALEPAPRLHPRPRRPPSGSDAAQPPPRSPRRWSEYDVVVHRPRDLAPLVQWIEEDPRARLVETAERMLRLRAPVDSPLLARLAAAPALRSLGEHRRPRLVGARLRGALGVEPPGDGDPGGDGWVLPWRGDGQRVAVFDSGVDAEHPDLAAAVALATAVPRASAEDRIGHGTHVAGILCGNGAASGGRVTGVAPGARLVSVGVVRPGGRMELPVDLRTLLVRAVEEGAAIINLSWGTPIHGSYDHGSLAVDQLAAEHPEVLVVVAAGNSGRAPEGVHLLQTVGTPASAKNALTVGACGRDGGELPPELLRQEVGGWFAGRFPREPACREPLLGRPDEPAAISSRGPTELGSVKPDLVAPGTYILAPRAGRARNGAFWATCDDFGGRYAYLGGSSMAAPAVAGAAAVLRQYLAEEHGLARPSAALLKALLLAATTRLPPRRLPEGAADLIGYPDFDQGFGRLDLRLLLPHPGAPPGRRLLWADVANIGPEALLSRAPRGGGRASARTYRFEVPPGTAGGLRVMLTWTDPPGVGLQNNLQLEVRGPAGELVVGNPEHRYLRGGTTVDALFDSPERAFDNRNNVEGVTVESPAAGSWRVRVRAQNTPFPPQGYALAVVGEVRGGLETAAPEAEG
jgi:subtilisin family serine protease